MTRKVFLLCLLGGILLPGATAAQDVGDEANATEDIGKWNIAISVVASNAAIKIVDSEVELPEAFDDTDFEVNLSEDLSVSSTIVSGSVGYRVLPFAEIYARAGFISSDTETGVTITGTPIGPLSDLVDGPVTIDGDRSSEVDGYSLGLGGRSVLPIAQIGDNRLAAYSGFQYVWNRFEDTVSSEGAKVSYGLLYPVNLQNRKIIYRVGGSYNWISRNVEQSLIFNGEPLRVQVTQELDNPWAAEAGVGIPIVENFLLGAGVWHQFSGETSFVASISYRFGS